MESKPTALIFGGTGALGSDLVTTLNKAGWLTTSVDVRESSRYKSCTAC